MELILASLFDEQHTLKIKGRILKQNKNHSLFLRFLQTIDEVVCVSITEESAKHVGS